MVLEEFFDGRSAQYAKRIEYLMESRLMSQGFKCFEPCVDDDGTDCVIKSPSGQFFEIQIKARKGEVGKKGIGRFEVKNPEIRPNYYYLFYAEIPDIMWLFSARPTVVISIVFYSRQSQIPLNHTTNPTLPVRPSDIRAGMKGCKKCIYFLLILVQKLMENFCYILVNLAYFSSKMG